MKQKQGELSFKSSETDFLIYFGRERWTQTIFVGEFFILLFFYGCINKTNEIATDFRSWLFQSNHSDLLKMDQFPLLSHSYAWQSKKGKLV